MITSNKMPELAATDIVKLRNGKIGIVLGNKNSNNHLAIYTNNTTCVSVSYTHLDVYKRQHHTSGQIRYNITSLIHITTYRCDIFQSPSC